MQNTLEQKLHYVQIYKYKRNNKYTKQFNKYIYKYTIYTKSRNNLINNQIQIQEYNIYKNRDNLINKQIQIQEYNIYKKQEIYQKTEEYIIIYKQSTKTN